MTRKYTRRAHLHATAAAVNPSPQPTVQTQTIEREPARPEPRDDPRARAAKRAQELRDHGALNRPAQDRFRMPDSPDGWEYEMRRVTVLNQEDPAYQVELAQMGWEPVPASRHPELMPRGFKGDVIMRDGLMLVERPKEICDEARALAYKQAVGQVKAMENKNAGVRDDGFDNTYRGKPIAEVKRVYGEPLKEGLSIPAD